MEYKIEKEFGTKWVKGLRSRKFKKGKFKLYEPTTDCHCALGVAAVVNDFKFTKNGILAVKENGHLYLYDDEVVSMNLYAKITEMNDHDDLPFRKIADWIEANVEFI